MVYSSVVTDAAGRSVFDLRRQGRRELLRFAGRVEYALDGDAILCRPLSRAGRREAESLLLSSVLAYVLERDGVLALHAAAVEIEGRAVALLAGSGGGKSTLALSLLAAGHRLLTDDVLPVETAAGILARPGYPQIRLADEVGLRQLGRAVEAWPKLLPDRGKRGVPANARGLGGFCPRRLPLAAIYSLDRRPEVAAPRLRRLSPRDALVELLRHSFAPRLAEGAGLRAERFARLGAVAAAVPLAVLSYPTGLGRLRETRRALLGDLHR